MNSKLKAGLTGGVLMGLLSIIPYVNLANCCCAWIFLGAGLASYLYIKRSGVPVLMAEGVQIGGVAGAVGGLINFLIGLPLNILAGNPAAGLIMKMMERLSPEQAGMFRQQMERQLGSGFLDQYLKALPGALIGLVMFVLLGVLGGLLAVVIFEKRKGDNQGPPPMPPPPQDFTPPPVVGTQPGAGYQP